MNKSWTTPDHRPQIIIGLVGLPQTALIIPAYLNSTLLMAKLIVKEEPQRERCFNNSYSVSDMSSNHSNNADTSAASKTGYSI